MVCLQHGFSTKTLGFSQGLSAGFMLAVTLLEILPEALTTLTIATAVAWVCVGVVSIYLIKVRTRLVFVRVLNLSIDRCMGCSGSETSIE